MVATPFAPVIWGHFYWIAYGVQWNGPLEWWPSLFLQRSGGHFYWTAYAVQWNGSLIRWPLLLSRRPGVSFTDLRTQFSEMGPWYDGHSYCPRDLGPLLLNCVCSLVKWAPDMIATPIVPATWAHFYWTAYGVYSNRPLIWWPLLLPQRSSTTFTELRTQFSEIGPWYGGHSHCPSNLGPLLLNCVQY